MNTQNLEKRHLVVNHIETERPFRIVGTAKKKDNESHYNLFLRILPGIPYFVVPHRERKSEFAIFSGKKKREDGSLAFFCKIGSGLKLFNGKAIELHLPDLRKVLYLKLETDNPQNTSCAEAKAEAA